MSGLEENSDPGLPGDEPTLRAALSEANIPTLLMVLAHLTGDDRWLSDPYRPRRGKALEDNDTGGLPAGVQQEIREQVLATVREFHAGRLTASELTPDRAAAMLAVALDEAVPAEYGPLLMEELGLISRDVLVATTVRPADLRVLIIGAGLSGLCAAIKLKAAGIPYVVVEKNTSVGGTWLENTYPGCGVDTPSHLYSFSFAPNTHWERYFAKRDQVADYLERLADRYGVRDDIRFGCEVELARYEPGSATWEVVIRTRGGREVRTCDVLISAVGMVNRPAVPPLPGLESFEGPAMHTAQWDGEVELAGKRVAVIGTGASAMQLVPGIADTVERVTVFQRSKQWALPHPNYQRAVSDATRYLMDNVPFYAAWYRLRAFWNFSDRLHPSLQIDPDWPYPDRSINAVNESHRVFLTEYIKSELGERQDLLDDCLPEYPPYGKRPLIDNGWFRAMCRDDVDLVTDPIAEIRPHSVVTENGQEYEADVIALATGFKTLQFLWPMDIIGKSGRTLTETWGPEDARAYLGITVPDFPNFFIINGPNTNAGHGGSAVIATEFQMRYIMQALTVMLEQHVAAIEVRPEVFETYNDELDAALEQSIWVHPGMTTYYRNSAGRVVISSPWKYLDYWGRTLRFEPSEFVLSDVGASERATAGAARN
jgi:4-hydroxyacetophenone monooxygenase